MNRTNTASTRLRLHSEISYLKSDQGICVSYGNYKLSKKWSVKTTFKYKNLVSLLLHYCNTSDDSIWLQGDNALLMNPSLVS